MLVWDEADVIACFNAVPTVDEFQTSHTFSATADGLCVLLTIRQYASDVSVLLYRTGVERPVFEVKLIDCCGMRYVHDKRGEYLEFAPSKCFGTRYDGLSPIPFGIRLSIRPHIAIAMFAAP